MSWIAILVLSLGSYTFKLVGVLTGERFSTRLAPITTLLPAAMFSALVIVMSVADGRSLTIDGRLVGVVVGLLAFWRRVPFIVVVILAMASTAVVRLLA